ncbi:(2Fe-2S)-binding domain protein [Thermobaculum terrenum ATCC BAA-798]|uniref:(2Fe-2S)-binding domain protein n=1 Tax=Thermobaculum terrenum (strain ATCC BAA-798 / CCMEE 7001 / YNP1) TaxID=525904 RepID=D1CHN2_THET1|nr:(2Fe-2S)-binding protein [Thermobaculum terrenum]ACZ43253.1 (2Fe-2S)-binding domain protein [Thermobaculum terrenum ATCC BAA-798]
MREITLVVNGRESRVSTCPDKPLLFVLREELGLTGAKPGCGEGVCGFCTVLVDGEPRRSCLLPVVSVEGREVTTIEGLAVGGELHPVQRAFIELGAMQCGYCTPGMIMSAVGLLRGHPSPTRSEIEAYMEGNICRCGTYPRILQAVMRAAEISKEVRG